MQQIDFLSVVSDESDTCSYLPEQTARMPLAVPTSGLTPQRFDQLLEAGYRRSGWFYYYTRCPRCSACEPLRLDAAAFQPSRSQRRAHKIGDRHLRVQLDIPTVDSQRVSLFNRHRIQRGLSHGESIVDESEYSSFLINSYGDVVELSLWSEDRLIAVSITDVGANSLSAVYCYFDPDFAWLNPGTYAILQQLRVARSKGFRWLYLGMMVSENSHLKYKANFRPHQRRIAGRWVTFD